MKHSTKTWQWWQILQLLFGFSAGAMLATVLMFGLFHRDFFPPTPTLAATVPALPVVEAGTTSLPDVDQIIVLPTETAQPTVTAAAAPILAVQQPTLIPSGTPFNHVTLVPTDRIIAVGDSVMLGGALELKKLLGDLDLDARVGRQPAAAVDVLRARHAAGQIGSIAIVHIGNNGPFTIAQIDEIMGLLAGARQVVFVNVKVPRRWENPNNVTLAEQVRQYSNAVLVDWYAASHNRPELFYDDGVHLRPEGARAYAALIASVFAGP